MVKLTFTIAFFCLLLLFTSLAFAKVVGWWRFEEGQGKEAEDLSGNSQVAVVTEGNLKWEKADLPPVASDSAVEFDGKTSLEVKANPLLDVPKITAEAWVKQTKISIYQPILFRGTYVINGSSQPGDFGGNGEIAYAYRKQARKLPPEDCEFRRRGDELLISLLHCVRNPSQRCL